MVSTRASVPSGNATIFRVLGADDGVAIGQIGAVCVAIWRRAVNQSRVQMMNACLAEVLEPGDACGGLLYVVEASSEAPDDELRRQLVANVMRHGDKVRCLAGVVEAAGFRGAIIRSGRTGRNGSSRSGSPAAIPMSAAATWKRNRAYPTFP